MTLKNIKLKPIYISLCFLTLNIFVFAQPSNDSECNAIPLTISETCNFSIYSNLGATNSTTMPLLTDSPYRYEPQFSSYETNLYTTSHKDVWFTVTVPANGVLIIDTEAGSLWDASMVLYSGTDCNNLTLINCNEVTGGGGSTNFMPIIAQNNLTPGSTVWIRIGSRYSTSTGDFGICVTSPNDLPNSMGNPSASDDCSNSQQICNLDGYYGSTVGFQGTTYSMWPALDNALPPGTGLQNDAYISVTANNSTISFDVWMTFSKKGEGVQIFLVSAPSCGGSPVNFNSYYWSPLRITHGKTNISFSGLTVGETYYLIADGAYSDEATFVIGNANGLAVSTYITQDDQTICLGSSTNLTCEGASGNYNWSDDGDGGLQTTNAKTVTVTPTAVGIITYTVTADQINSNCPSTPAEATLEVINAPIANAGGTAGICPNENYTISSASSNVADINWTIISGNGTLTNGNSLSPTYNAVQSDQGGNVILQLEAGPNCATPDYDQFILSIDNIPDFKLNQNYFICPYETINLEISDSINMSSIEWKDQNNNILSNYFDYDFSPGTYNATLTSPNGCFKDTTIIINTQSEVSISQLLNSTCLNTFQMSNNTGGDQNGTNGVWSFVSNDGTVTFSNNNTINTTAIFSNFGQYELIFTDNNCPLDDDTLIITYSDKPYFDFPTDLFYCPGEAGVSLEITDSLNMNGVSWNYPQSAVNTIFNSTLTQGNHPIRLTNKYNCSNDTTIQITTQASIQLIDPSNNGKLCLFNITDTLFILALSGDTLGGGWDYTTTTNGNATFLIDSASTLFQVTEYGPYTVWFIDNVCQTADTLSFIITPGSYFEVEDYQVCNGFTQEITPNIYTPNQFIEYLEWNTGETTQNITVSSEGYYTLTISTGCGNDFSDSSFVDYKVCDIKMPNIITPNGDGINDEYVILGEVDAFKEFSIIITNRWGNVVTTYNDINGTWDGKDQGGKAVDDGVYFYTVQAVTIEDVPITKQGFIQVINN